MRHYILAASIVFCMALPAHAESQFKRMGSGGVTTQPVYQNGKSGKKAPSYVYQHERREGEGKPYYSGRAGGENRPSYDYNRGKTNPTVSPLRRERTTSPVTTNVWNEERNRSPFRTVTPKQYTAGGVTTVCPSRLSERDRSKCVKDWVEAKDRIRRKYDD